VKRYKDDPILDCLIKAQVKRQSYAFSNKDYERIRELPIEEYGIAVAGEKVPESFASREHAEAWVCSKRSPAPAATGPTTDSPYMEPVEGLPVCTYKAWLCKFGNVIFSEFTCP